MRVHLRLLALAGASAIVLAGCGASHPDRQPTTASGTAMTPGMIMPDGSTMGMDAAGPSAAAQMICADETRTDVRTVLGLDAAPAASSTWANSLYTCTYRLPMGTLVVSVKQSADPATAQSYFASLRNTLGPTETLSGLGQNAYGTAAGLVVLIKDSDTLTVDATRLPPVLGTQQSKRFDFAYELASDILGCWTGG